ncbi:hypothetical protein IEO70_04015 [Bacillus sp. AGMB 02131]|uniref:Uncharacterized protein n=1 Tax=Peribacillus faecalis TaxID=2772559 RepID=A0A927CTE3_9BACI|nr:hypothetical protein [Peribacillus faecalis]MBD3107522.1 hypothetical protein [Peribacillus faecalis]
MIDSGYEKQQLHRLNAYIFVVLALIFSLLFLFTSIFILLFPMVSIWDLAYLPSKIALFTFALSVIFSALSIKNAYGKIVLVLNTCLLIFMSILWQ